MNHGAIDHGARATGPSDDSASYLAVNVAISDTDLQPASIFVPAGRPVQLTLRNRGTREHHYHVVGLAPEDLWWIERGAPRPSVVADEEDDEHSNHHDRQVTRVRAGSPMGVRPSGREVHAYVAVPGEIDIVFFKASQTGRFAVRCDVHDEELGTLTVFDAAGAAAGAEPAMPGHLLARALTKNLGAVDFPGAAGVQVDATYAPPEFVTQALGGVSAASALQPDRYIAFLVTERTHSTNLPGRPVAPALFVDGRPVSAVDAKVMADSVHHRATLHRFTRDAAFGKGHQVVTLRLAAGREATWHLPLILPATSAASAGTLGAGEQWGLILALLGGMVAAMWPCLFQLTVYFIPALAGVAMQDTGDTMGGRRRQVLVAAFYFILGFTLVYTATGALIGLAAQRLGEQQQFEDWQRYFSMAAGVVVIGLALRTAAKARAPLICRMPLLSGMTRSNRPATRVEMMLAGLAFATGCMTCFGSALVVGMVVYVGLAQSALYGALVLFLFSLGMGIPLVVAALAMARALPLLFKLESAVPWMGLGSAVLMAGFGVLLTSGNYMLVSEWTFRVVNGTVALPHGAVNAAVAALVAAAASAAWLVWKQRASPRASTEQA